MKIKILAVGDNIPSWVTEGTDEYLKRIAPPFKPEIIDIPLAKRVKNKDIAQYKAQESTTILKHIQPHDRVIALEITGQIWSTETLAQHLEQWKPEGQNLCFVIGGPDGLAENCLARANNLWSFSKLTLPHPLVRIILVEQLYRAFSILNQHPYHR